MKKIKGTYTNIIYMVRKKTFLLSMAIAAMLLCAVNAETSPFMERVSTRAAAFGDLTGMSVGTYATGLLVEYTILLAAVYFFLRGVVKRFGA